METFDQADSGYPEEGPPGAAPDEGGESAVRESSEDKARDEQQTPDNDDGTATGNPRSAG